MWWGIVHPMADMTRVSILKGARLATRRWKKAMESEQWDSVDGRCFALAVLDKVMQL
jgi:hypothetical protein